MKWMFGKSASWLLVTILVAAGAFAAVQELPEGDGKKLIQDRCGACHGLDLITSGPKLDRDGWKKMVEKMVGYGATMDDKETGVAADYLAKNFGPKGSAESSSAEDEKTAKKYMEGICSSCHDAGLITGAQASREGWVEIVQRMNGKGAGLSEKDVQLLVDYLFKNYGTK